MKPPQRWSLLCLVGFSDINKLLLRKVQEQSGCLASTVSQDGSQRHWRLHTVTQLYTLTSHSRCIFHTWASLSYRNCCVCASETVRLRLQDVTMTHLQLNHPTIVSQWKQVKKFYVKKKRKKKRNYNPPSHRTTEVKTVHKCFRSLNLSLVLQIELFNLLYDPIHMIKLKLNVQQVDTLRSLDAAWCIIVKPQRAFLNDLSSGSRLTQQITLTSAALCRQ